ncbi:uncharacterized protein LOC119088250 [Peromyscus leucopus]|uniref:uncharacterized protein LOC119088250 n=1 Tax=Peromyscus leucopus TaxID=10041 RepID=UPI00188504FE|nr:uncharacterized protein LOC119088250 [Peromyscus leucopus]
MGATSQSGSREAPRRWPHMGPSGRRGRQVSDQAAALGAAGGCGRAGERAGEASGAEESDAEPRRAAVLSERRSSGRSRPPLPGDRLASPPVARPEPLPSADGSGRGRGRRAPADRRLAPPGAERAGAERSNCRLWAANRSGDEAAGRGGGGAVRRRRAAPPPQFRRVAVPAAAARSGTRSPQPGA